MCSVLPITGLLNDTVSSSDYTAWNDEMINNYMEMMQSSPNLRQTYFLKVVTKTRKSSAW